jgi:hypothetical protein
MPTFKFSRNLGLMLVGVWFILSGVDTILKVGIPGIVMGILALIAGVLVFIEYKD